MRNFFLTILLFSLSIHEIEAKDESLNRLFLGVEKERIRAILDLSYDLDSRAEKEISQLESEFPDSPVLGLLKTGAGYWNGSYEEWPEDVSDEFEELALDSLKQAIGYLKTHGDDPDAKYAVAVHEIILTMYYVDHRRWWAAFWKARSGLKKMRQLLETDSNYTDAKMILGVAYCYAAKTPPYLKPMTMLMNFRGDMEKGLTYLTAAKNNGLFSKVDARYYLGAVHWELHNDIERAASEFEILANQYSNNWRFHNLMGEVERTLKREAEASDRMQSVVSGEGIENYPRLQIRAYMILCWSSLNAERPELALKSASSAQKLTVEGRNKDMRPSVLLAKGYALKKLRRNAEALEVFESISNNHKNAYQNASTQIKELRELL